MAERLSETPRGPDSTTTAVIGSAQAPLDIIGFGALNVDYIASASQLSNRMAENIAESLSRFEWNIEGPVDEPTILTAMERLGTASLASSLGGSAWITIFSLAQMRMGLRLGYVGVVGYMVRPGLSFLNQMDQLGIDRTWVGVRLDRPCGLCLSYINDTERVMLVHPGANFEMNDHLSQNFERVAAYLASARYVHLTSFLDDLTPSQVAKVLERAREINSELQIGFDPGYDWCNSRTSAVRAILRLTDLLFVNYREFKTLGGYAHGESDDTLAGRILEYCGDGCRIFVAKRYDVAEVFRSTRQGITVNKFLLQGSLQEHDLEDATGAGDVFSAGIVAALSSRRLQLELGGYLGLSLARHKLHDSPASRIPPDLSKGFLQQVEFLASSPVKDGSSILLIYNDDTYCRQVEEFVKKRCHLSIERWSFANATVKDLIRELGARLSKCCFAICIFDRYEAGVDGRLHANLKTIHQAGILQGRYGFGRVALLVEVGYDVFSNIAGLIRLDFPAGRVDITFLELERMLAREGLIVQRGMIT